MGSVFLVPWAWVEDPQTQLNRLGFRTAAMALSPGSVEIDNPSLLPDQAKIRALYEPYVDLDIHVPSQYLGMS